VEIHQIPIAIPCTAPPTENTGSVSAVRRSKLFILQ
jgi:hypothetical protein